MLQPEIAYPLAEQRRLLDFPAVNRRAEKFTPEKEGQGHKLQIQTVCY